jgi:hypothetical protein
VTVFSKEAESIYHVRGEIGEDPTEPHRSGPFPYAAISHDPRIQQLSDDFARLGLNPFHTPLGVMLDEKNRQNPAAIAQFLGAGNSLMSKVRVSSLDGARDAIDLVAATVDAPGLVEHAIFGEDLGDGSAATGGIVFTEDVVKIAGQQGRYTVGHNWSVFTITNFSAVLPPKQPGYSSNDLN